VFEGDEGDGMASSSSKVLQQNTTATALNNISQKEAKRGKLRIYMRL
jgi:hypothetical protein